MTVPWAIIGTCPAGHARSSTITNTAGRLHYVLERLIIAWPAAQPTCERLLIRMHDSEWFPCIVALNGVRVICGGSLGLLF
jgi:hypothetical protein